MLTSATLGKTRTALDDHQRCGMCVSGDDRWRD